MKLTKLGIQINRVPLTSSAGASLDVEFLEVKKNIFDTIISTVIQQCAFKKSETIQRKKIVNLDSQQVLWLGTFFIDREADSHQEDARPNEALLSSLNKANEFIQTHPKHSIVFSTNCSGGYDYFELKPNTDSNATSNASRWTLLHGHSGEIKSEITQYISEVIQTSSLMAAENSSAQRIESKPFCLFHAEHSENNDLALLETILERLIHRNLKKSPTISIEQRETKVLDDTLALDLYFAYAACLRYSRDKEIEAFIPFEAMPPLDAKAAERIINEKFRGSYLVQKARNINVDQLIPIAIAIPITYGVVVADVTGQFIYNTNTSQGNHLSSTAFGANKLNR